MKGKHFEFGQCLEIGCCKILNSADKNHRCKEHQKKIIVMVFKEKDAPQTNKWSLIYKMSAEKQTALDKDLEEWCEADMW